jgi:hypothetical protein
MMMISMLLAEYFVSSVERVLAVVRDLDDLVTSARRPRWKASALLCNISVDRAQRS